MHVRKAWRFTLPVPTAEKAAGEICAKVVGVDCAEVPAISGPNPALRQHLPPPSPPGPTAQRQHRALNRWRISGQSVDYAKRKGGEKYKKNGVDEEKRQEKRSAPRGKLAATQIRAMNSAAS